MDDEAILSLFLQRQDAALSAAEAKYGRLCYRTAEGILHDPRDAEECVNDVWLRAWDAIPPQQPRSLSSWLVKVTRNLAITRLRSRTAEKRGGDQLPLLLEELAQCVPGAPDPQRVLESREISEHLNRFLSGLRQEERDVFVSRYFFAAPVAELAQKTGWTKGRINSMLQRTRRKLRDYLKEEGLW